MNFFSNNPNTEEKPISTEYILCKIRAKCAFYLVGPYKDYKIPK